MECGEPVSRTEGIREQDVRYLRVWKDWVEGYDQRAIRITLTSSSVGDALRLLLEQIERTTSTRDRTEDIDITAHWISSCRSWASLFPVQDDRPVDCPTPRELYRRTSYPCACNGLTMVCNTLEFHPVVLQASRWQRTRVNPEAPVSQDTEDARILHPPAQPCPWMQAKS